MNFLTLLAFLDIPENNEELFKCKIFSLKEFYVHTYIYNSSKSNTLGSVKKNLFLQNLQGIF